MGFVDMGPQRAAPGVLADQRHVAPLTFRVLGAGAAVAFSSGALTGGFGHEGGVWEHAEEYPSVKSA